MLTLTGKLEVVFFTQITLYIVSYYVCGRAVTLDNVQ